MAKWFFFVILTGCVGVSNVAEAQSIDFNRRLADQLPTPPFAPSSMKACLNLEARWADVQRQISAAHQQCLIDDSGEPSLRPGSDCSVGSCEHLHDLMFNRQLRDMRSAQASACREAVDRNSRSSRLTSVLESDQPSDRSRYIPQPWEKPWEPPQSAALPHLSDEQKAGLERSIEHWVSLPARQREELMRLVEMDFNDPDVQLALNWGNPIDGRHPIAITITITQLLDRVIKRSLETADRRTKRRICRIYFPRGINLPSQCR